jgi:hypothetical protein
MSVRFSKKSEKELEELKTELKTELKKELKTEQKKELKISITRNKEDIRIIVISNNQKIFECTFTTSEKKLIINDVFLDTKSEAKNEKSQEEKIKNYEKYKKTLLKLTKKLIQPKESKRGSKGSKRGSKGGKKRTFRRKNKLIGGTIGLKILSSIAFCFTCLCIYGVAVNKNGEVITLSAFGTFLGILLLVASEISRYNGNIPDDISDTDSPNNNERIRSSRERNQHSIIPTDVEEECLAIMVHTMEEGSHVQQAVVTNEVSHNPINYVQSMIDLINNNNNNTGLSFFVLLNFIFTILPRRAFDESSQSVLSSNLPTSTEYLQIEPVQTAQPVGQMVTTAIEIHHLEDVVEHVDIVIASNIEEV